jgi:fatty-acyl-CoA synthase
MVGASPLPEAVREGFQAHTGIPLVEGYGLTEATCASARSFPAAPRQGAVGQRFPYQRISAVRIEPDGSWTHLPAGETGVLAVHGPTVFAGYLAGRGQDGFRLDGLGKLSQDGWLDTGDLGYLDEDGFVYLRGRAKDLIIRGGHNIDPTVIEDALLAHPLVSASAAVGRPDPHSGEVPVAFVTLAPGAHVTEQELSAWAAEHVAERAAAPKHVTILDVLPVTDVGKPYKLALRAQAAQSELDDALAGLSGVHEVKVRIDDGEIAADVVIGAPLDESAVKTVLSRYAMKYTITQKAVSES